jgi:ADP-ribose diphosphatase
MFIYIAEDLVKTNQNLDEDEFLEVLEIEVEEIDEILRSPIDGKTLYALSYIKSNLKK